MISAYELSRPLVQRTILLGAVCVWGSMGCQIGPGRGVELRIEAPDADADADVYVDGHYLGQVGDVGGIALSQGAHRVEVRKPGRFPVQQTVRVHRDTADPYRLQAELLSDPPR